MRKFRHPEESKKIFDVLSGMTVDEAKEAVDDCYMTLLDMKDCAAEEVYLGKNARASEKEECRDDAKKRLEDLQKGVSETEEIVKRHEERIKKLKEDNKECQERLKNSLAALNGLEKEREERKKSLRVDRYISVGVLICVLLSMVIRIFLAMG